MTLNTEHLPRAADGLRHWLLGRLTSSEVFELPKREWEQTQRTAYLLEHARSRGWHFATLELRMQLLHRTCGLQNHLASLSSASQREREPPAVPSTRHIMDELQSLLSEFDQLRVDLKAHEVAVTTEPIAFDGIELGPFEIRLNWTAADHSAAYSVLALEPHPAATNSGVTHPHVRDDRLCEGDGRQAIAAALAEGRFYDFFLIVAQLVRTYSRGSAFIEMESWEGAPCSDCGTLVTDGDTYECEQCNAMVCSDCHYGCESCHRCTCSECNSSCARCDSSFCSSCLTTCAICDASICGECRIADVCTSCHEEQETFHDEELEAEEAATSQPCS